MVAVISSPATQQSVSVRSLIISYIQEQIDLGYDLREAGNYALRRLISEGLARDVLTLLGATPLMDLWRYETSSRRQRFNVGAKERDEAEEGDQNDTETQHSSVTQLRGVSALLADNKESFLEVEFAIGPRTFVRLGDMMTDHCRIVWTGYAKQANTMADWARFFRKLEEKLPPQKRVRECFAENDLLEIKAEAEAKKP